MEAKITLSREKKYWCYGPGDRVEGKLIVHNHEPVFCSGIRVSLEAIVRVNFKDSDGRLISKTENGISPSIFTYVWPINWSWAQITGKFDDEKQVRLPASKHVFSFHFYYPANPLPGTFCSEYGSIKHQISAYILTNTKNHQVASHILNFGDYLNLLQVPIALRPLKLEKKKKSLMFSIVHPSSSSPLQFQFKMNQRGFLPGEYAAFTFKLTNITGKSLSRIVISLIQKVSYVADKCKKTFGNVLDEAETVGMDSAVETIWESGLSIPLGVKPTFHKSCIEHQYFIKVHIFSKSNSTRPTLKGHVPIIIGTCREIAGQGGMCLRCRDGRTCHGYYNTSSSGSRGRRSSTDFLRDSGSEFPSMTDLFSPPPSYSQLSSRAPSVDFLPLYEEAMKTEKNRAIKEKAEKQDNFN